MGDDDPRDGICQAECFCRVQMRGVVIRHDWLRHDHRGRGRRGAVESDALTIVSQWKEFRTPDFEAIKAALRTPVVFDGRNLYEPSAMAVFGD